MFQRNALPLSTGCVDHVSVMQEGWRKVLTSQSYETPIVSLQVLFHLLIEIPCNFSI